MPWFAVDDDLPHHPKVTAAGNSAMGMWVRAGAWSMKYLTEGHIPAEIAQTLGSTTDASRLVKAGLWERVEDGYRFHEWGPRQRSKAKVTQDRKAGRERIRKLRALTENVHDIGRDSG